MWIKVFAGILAVIGAFGFLLLGIGAGLTLAEDRPEEIRVGVIMLVVVGLITFGMVIGSYLLFRHAKRPPLSRLSWVPAASEWLHQRAWTDLPDSLPELPRGRALSPPACGVPPDELLRRLWSVRAELAFARRSRYAMLPFSGWLGTIACGPLLILFLLFLGALLISGLDTDTVGINLMALDGLACLLFVSIAAVVRPLRRYFAVVRLERELTARDAARPDGAQGGLPLPPTGTIRPVTDPHTGYTGYYHPALVRIAA